MKKMLELKKMPSNLKNYHFRIGLIFVLLIFSGCSNQRKINHKLNSEMPPKILWAWERPEDLRFIDTDEFGVAFLAQVLTLQNDEINYNPRRQPLELAPQTYLIAVTRIETSKDSAKRPTLSDEQRKKVVNYIKKTLELPNIKAIQIDFDATVSERAFYRKLVNDLRKELPENFPFTITALASWCVGDAWFNDFPVDEAVPMAFVMGADTEKIRTFLESGNDWREPLCRGSYGISIDEPLNINFKPNRRFYYFKSKAWTKADIERIK
ncbi:hypothetical protein BH10ACI1_BH10ACI1_13620 [soil metagenome]